MTAYAPTDVLTHLFEQPTHSGRLYANVEFGVMQSDGNCVNIGICRINTTHCTEMTVARHKQRGCPFAEVILSISSHGRLRAFFPRAGMKPCTERAFFRGPVFPVPVAYYLPDSVQQGLPGLTEPIVKAGLYPIHRSEKGYWIEF